MFVKDAATGEFSRPISNSYNIHEATNSIFNTTSNNMSFNLDNRMEKFFAMDNQAEASSKNRGSRKRGEPTMIQ